ncbi:polar amino acid ABC transporter permease, partial [Marinomonas sp. 42_23_T18]
MTDYKYKTDLPVLLPAAKRLARKDERDAIWGFGLMRPSGRQLSVFAIFLILITGVAEARSPDNQQGIISILIEWTPFLFEGFLFNILISAMAMLLGTVLGGILGLMQISLIPSIKHSSWFVTQFFRNSPWLCLLFFTMYMLPFEFDLGFVVIPFPDWLKAVLGLSLPIMANMSEIVRGAIQSIPFGQWEAAESLAFTRRQQLWQIILPQCV